MTKPPRSTPKGATPQSREDRLKAALKANMAKRKAQSRARGDGRTEARDPPEK